MKKKRLLIFKKIYDEYTILSPMELSFYLVSLLILLGLLSGIVSTIAGIGGGVFFVSIMNLLIFKTIDQFNIAVDTSTFVILFSSLAGFIPYLRQKRTGIKLSLFFSAFSVIGSILATILFSVISIDNSILIILFAVTLLIAGFNMIYKATKAKKGADKHEANHVEFSLNNDEHKISFKKTIPLFILAGFTANLLGIGGGIINTPTLNIVLSFPIHNSTAISTSIIFFTAIYNTIIKSLMGHIYYLIGILIAVGSILGSIIGAKISKKMPKVFLQFFVAIILISLALRMFFE